MSSHRKQKPIVKARKQEQEQEQEQEQVYTLTKYERTHVIGIRAEQLARGAQAFVDLPPPVHGMSANSVYFSIAERELDEHRLPFLIVRKMPDGSELSFS
jgi:DNA-directed RNA polymerase subunit K/omega